MTEVTLPPVTVVVASYRKAATIRACLAALAATDYPDLELLVVDSGSEDGTLDVLRRQYPRLRVLVMPGASLPAALNAGFRAAGGRDVVRIHGDVALRDPDWLRRLATAARQCPRAGVVGVKLVYPDGKIQSAGREILTGLGASPATSDRRAHEFDRIESGPPVEVDSVRGACAYYRREVLEHVALDERYAPALGPDDDDFCLEARRRGFKVYVDCAVTAVHFTPHRAPQTPVERFGEAEELAEALEAGDRCRAAMAPRFAAKWGFDLRGPDLHEVRRRYGETEICWRIGAPLRYTPSGERPPVDIAIAVYNSEQVLPRQLAAFAATRWPELRLYVVDNASTDSTPQILEDAKSWLPFPIHVHRLPVNTGVVPGMNLAFSLGSAPLVARLDDDAMPEPDWLERMVPRFAQRPFAAVVATRVLHDGEGHALQGRPNRTWPRDVPIGDQVDRGQFDGLVRVASLCGCCGVYRRDALREGGLLDVRYAPTQYDETDHHVTLGYRGYELLYDGSVVVRHAISHGRSQTRAALTSVVGNRGKFFGKWGYDVFERFNRAIDLSREGRVLPPDGDTSGYLASSPSGQPADARSTAEGPSEPCAEAARLLAARARALGADGVVTRIAAMAVLRAAREIDRGEIEAAGEWASFAVDVLPYATRAIALLAQRFTADGDLVRARQMLRDARLLAPEDDELRTQLRTMRAPRAERPEAVPARSEPGTLAAPSCADGIALLAPFGTKDPETRGWIDTWADAYGGAGIAAAHVATFGATIRASVDRPRAVHAFDWSDPVRLLDQVKGARVTAAPEVPIWLSPFEGDRATIAWGAKIVPELVAQASDAAELDALLAAVVGGRLEVHGRTDRVLPSLMPSWQIDYERELLATVDELVLHDQDEFDRLAARHDALPPHRLQDWPNPGCTEAGVTWIPDGGAAFVTEFGVRDFILVPGPIQPVHNQVIALHALRDLPCVVIHPPAGWRDEDLRYGELCRAVAGPKTRFVPELSPALWLSALQAAALVAWPSFCDRPTGVVARARAFGTPVLCPRASALERGLGELARPVDPCDVPGMQRHAVAALERVAASVDPLVRSVRAVHTIGAGCSTGSADPGVVPVSLR